MPDIAIRQCVKRHKGRIYGGSHESPKYTEFHRFT